MISQSELKRYVNNALAETMIREQEQIILGIMKLRQEEYPSEWNNREWLEMSDHIAKRRGSRPIGE